MKVSTCTHPWSQCSHGKSVHQTGIKLHQKTANQFSKTIDFDNLKVVRASQKLRKIVMKYVPIMVKLQNEPKFNSKPIRTQFRSAQKLGIK